MLNPFKMWSSQNFVIAHPIGVEAQTVAEIIGENLGSDYTILSSLGDFRPRENHTLIFVDGAMAVNMIDHGLLKTSLEHKCHLIFLVSFGVARSDLTQIMTIVPDAIMCYTSFADHGENIGYELHEVAASKAQISNLGLCVGFPIVTQRNLNVGLPVEIAYPQKPVKVRVRDLSLESSPKLQKLLTIITLNREARHVVYSQFSDAYGTKLIGAYLRHHGLLSAETDVSKFNARSGPAVLLTSHLFGGELPRDVTLIHIVDPIEPEILRSMIHQVYKYANYTKTSPHLQINFYVTVAEGFDESNLDVEAYLAIGRELTEWIETWSQIKLQVRPLVLGSDGRLTLVE